MQVLLCLLSTQHVPNLLSVHQLNPDALVLVATPQMLKQQADRHFLNALSLGEKSYSSRCVVVELEQEDSFESIREALKRAFQHYPTAKWSVNITGGTKPMSIATYEFFKALSGDLFYTNFSTPNKITNVETNEYYTCTHKLTVEEFLAGYGGLIETNSATLKARQERNLEWERTAIAFALNASEVNYLKVDEATRQTIRKNGGILHKSSFNFPSCDLERLWFNGATERKFSKYECDFFTGGWLETFFCNLLYRHQSALHVWDIGLGRQTKTNGGVSNELDVSFMKDYGLYIIECKTGSQEHDYKADNLYKIEAVKSQFKALNAKSIFATTAKNIKATNGGPKEAIKRRAEQFNCKLILTPMISSLARNYDDAAFVSECLFSGNA